MPLFQGGEEGSTPSRAARFDAAQGVGKMAIRKLGELETAGSNPAALTCLPRDEATHCTALVVQRRGHRTRNAATWVRVPPGAFGLFDNSVAVEVPMM